MSTNVETDAISEYLDRVYSPIAIDEADTIKWSARAMRTEMEDRIRAAVSQLEEIGRPHNAAVQEVVAKLKDPDTARREVLQAARIAIKRSEYAQEREKTPWWRRDPEGWWLIGASGLSYAVRGIVHQTVNRDPAADIVFVACCFIVAFGGALMVGRTRRPTPSVSYYFLSFAYFLVWGAIESLNPNPEIRAIATMSVAMAGVLLALGIREHRFAKSNPGPDTSFWNRKAQ